MYNDLHSKLADEVPVGNEADSLELDPISTKCYHQLELYACRLSYGVCLSESVLKRLNFPVSGKR
jgi:hypothetical protein